MNAATCPCCGQITDAQSYRVDRVPIHSVKTYRTMASVRKMVRGTIALVECSVCSHVWNTTFDPRHVTYGDDYESTQSASTTFNRFHADLAYDLVDRFSLRGKCVAEIGCGQGEFLGLLHDAGVARTIGIDPAFRGTHPHPSSQILAAELEASPTMAPVDFICCKMTLEHIHDARSFLDILHKMSERSSAPVFLMVPNAEKVFDGGAFWDIYYEHVHYFTARSLTRLAESVGFGVQEVKTLYDDQYLSITARANLESIETKQVRTLCRFATFSDRAYSNIRYWRDKIGTAANAGPIALWGGGSKAVAFLTATETGDSIDAVVDINPARQGSYLPPYGHKIISPDALKSVAPRTVIVMNPIYRAEISENLRDLDIETNVLTLSVDEPL